MKLPRVTVRRYGGRWGVTDTGGDWILADFALRQDAMDYARALAVAEGNSIVEEEDVQGRVALRQLFSLEASGIVRVRPIAE
jgi:hypothetical protein